jgi:hypothetical protein
MRKLIASTAWFFNGLVQKVATTGSIDQLGLPLCSLGSDGFLFEKHHEAGGSC